jgi:hypothetical protein
MDGTLDNLFNDKVSANQVSDNQVFNDVSFDEVLGNPHVDPDKYISEFTNTVEKTPLFASQPKETAVPVGAFSALSHSLQPRSGRHVKKEEISDAGGNGEGEFGGEAQRNDSRMWLPY